MGVCPLKGEYSSFLDYRSNMTILYAHLQLLAAKKQSTVTCAVVSIPVRGRKEKHKEPRDRKDTQDLNPRPPVHRTMFFCFIFYRLQTV